MRLKKRYRVVAKYDDGINFDDELNRFFWTRRGAKNEVAILESIRRSFRFLRYNYVIWDNESQSELKREA